MGASDVTPREREFLQLSAAGWQDEQIAAFCDVSKPTVINLLKRARRRMGARNTTHAVVLALKAEIIEFPPEDEDSALAETQTQAAATD